MSWLYNPNCPLWLSSVLFRLSCPGYIVPVVLSQLFCSSTLILSSFVPHFSLIAVMSWPSCPLCPVLSRLTCQARLSRLTILGSLVPGVLSGLFCPSCHVPDVLLSVFLPQLSHLGCSVPAVLAVMIWPSCSLFPVLTVQSCLSSPAVLSRLSGPGCPVPAVLSQLSCPSFPVPAFLSQLSCPSFPVPAALPQLSCPSCLFQAVLPRHSCLSIFVCALFCLL
jgi:hypothetical protein